MLGIQRAGRALVSDSKCINRLCDSARRLLSNASSVSTSGSARLQDLQSAPTLQDFMRQRSHSALHDDSTRPVSAPDSESSARRVYLETYGCQMNVSDTEVVLSILRENQYAQTQDVELADVILVNTCAIRENAEGRVWGRLGYFKSIKNRRRQARGSGPVVGVLGCMAERLKEKLLDSDRLADVVAGPDAYRDLPRLLDAVQGGGGGREGAMNVQLSLEETYADIAPTRQAGQRSAFVSIMRGCNNMCAFCIVPFTRGRERSRPAASILEEVHRLSEEGVREVTLLGQNVNSYADFSQWPPGAGSTPASEPSTSGRELQAAGVYAPGFSSVYKPKRQGAVQFAELLDAVARVDPEMRVRFTSPHPKDFNEDVLQVIAAHHNVCLQLHMPAQSGSSEALHRMRRGYTREAYDALVGRVREVLPSAALSTDIIVGFCGETEEEHQATVDLLHRTAYDNAFLFAYSDRGKTYAARHYQDDVPQDVKDRRLQEVLAVSRKQQALRNQQEVGRVHLVLTEGPSKKSPTSLQGRTCTMKRVVFPDIPLPPTLPPTTPLPSPPASDHYTCNRFPASSAQLGEYVAVVITGYSHSTLLGTPLGRTSIAEFAAVFGSTAPLADMRGIAQQVARQAEGGSVGCEVIGGAAAMLVAADVGA